MSSILSSIDRNYTESKNWYKTRKHINIFLERPIMNKKLLLVVGTAIATGGLYSATLNAALVNASASANVLTPLDITAGAAMDFGDVAGDVTSATTVVLTTLGVTSSTDGASAAGTPAAGVFNVTGAGTLSYSITLPADGTVTLGGAGTAMAVNGFNHDAGGAPALTGGTASFNVGATLTINANQTAGAYTGNYDVTVNYQ
jgi:Domain of unknown function (DUF4402)